MFECVLFYSLSAFNPRIKSENFNKTSGLTKLVTLMAAKPAEFVTVNTASIQSKNIFVLLSNLCSVGW